MRWCEVDPPTPAKADDDGSGDGADSPDRLVRADVERDTRALTEAVEQDLAAKADPAKPDEAVDQTVYILTTKQKSNDDTSPLQFIINEKLAYFEGLEKAVMAFAEAIGALSASEQFCSPKQGSGGGLRG
jgi:hypothetical protein